MSEGQLDVVNKEIHKLGVNTSDLLVTDVKEIESFMKPLVHFSASAVLYSSTYKEYTDLRKYFKSGTKLSQKHEEVMQKETDIGSLFKDISRLKPVTGCGVVQSYVKTAQMMDRCLPLFGQYEGLVKEQIKAVHIQTVHRRSAADILPKHNNYYLKCYNDETLSWAQALENIISESKSKFAPPLTQNELIKCGLYMEEVNVVQIGMPLQEIGKQSMDNKNVNTVTQKSSGMVSYNVTLLSKQNCTLEHS